MANLFSDGFESGNLNAWSSAVIDSGDLSAATAAKLHGNYGLSCLIDDTVSIYVKDDTPTTETRYRCRFYFDPHTLTMANGDYFMIAVGMDSGWENIFGIILYYDATGYQIQVRIYNDALGMAETGLYLITDAPHCIEIDWMAATGAGANNGYVKLWIDGALKETKGSIDNDTRRLGFIFLGADAFNVSATSGTFFLDDFASNNDGSAIGLIRGKYSGNVPARKYFNHRK